LPETSSILTQCEGAAQRVYQLHRRVRNAGVGAVRFFAESLPGSYKKALYSNKAAEIMDVQPQFTADIVRRHHAQLLIHGHTHREHIHQEDGFTRIVLGDWKNDYIFGEQPF